MTVEEASLSTTGGEGEPPAPQPAAARRRKKSARAAQYWMLVSSPDNYRRTGEGNFAVQGIKSRHRRRAETMRAGDRLLFYVTGRMAFAATCTLTSGVFEDHSRVWRSVRAEETYPWRVRLRPNQVLPDAAWLPAKEVAFRLEYVRKWPPEHWTLAFQGHLHQLPQKDFKLIEESIRRARSGR